MSAQSVDTGHGHAVRVFDVRAEAAQAWKFHAVIESQMRHRVAEIAALQGAVRDLDGRISKMEHDALRALAVRVTQLEAQI